MNLSNMSETEKRKHFEKINENNLHAKKKSKCMYKDCSRYSIDSHAISKNYHIKQIAENNVVMSFIPRRNAESKDLILDEVGVNKASVFQGFCKEHDEIFKSVDTNGIKTIGDLLLQCYRSVCFWLHMLTIDGKMMGEIQKDSDDTLKAFFEKIVPEFNYDEFRFGDEYLKGKKNYVSFVQRAKEELESALDKKNILKKLDRNMKILAGDLEIYFCKVDEQIPVVLNTMNTIEKGYNFFHIVLPNKDSTDIIVISASNGTVDLKDAWKSATSNMLSLIELIESWMIACEIWYIRPSVIKKIPKERMDIICQDIRYWQGENPLWQRYDMSIFDDLRLKYLDLYKQNNCILKEFEEKEMKKFMPQKRLEKEQRELNMKRKFGELQFYGDFS